MCTRTFPICWQLRCIWSLPWAARAAFLSQERPEKEAFVTELRDFEVCPDAAHWRLEGVPTWSFLLVIAGMSGKSCQVTHHPSHWLNWCWQRGSLRCEYLGVRGGVLADAIGYGKTACTIGLIDKTKAWRAWSTTPKVLRWKSTLNP